MLSSELHNRTTFLPFNMETHLVSSGVDTIDIVDIIDNRICRSRVSLSPGSCSTPWSAR